MMGLFPRSVPTKVKVPKVGPQLHSILVRSNALPPRVSGALRAFDSLSNLTKFPCLLTLSCHDVPAGSVRPVFFSTQTMTFTGAVLQCDGRSCSARPPLLLGPGARPRSRSLCRGFLRILHEPLRAVFWNPGRKRDFLFISDKLLSGPDLLSSRLPVKRIVPPYFPKMTTTRRNDRPVSTTQLPDQYD